MQLQEAVVMSTGRVAFRYQVPGVELISPPPHHDIYSIEDMEKWDVQPGWFSWWSFVKSI